MGLFGYKLSDSVKGQWRSVRNGTGGSFSATFREVQRAKRERQMNEQFGTGEEGAGGDERNWQAPVHGTTRDGRPVTVSFGIGRRSGETLIADGHVSFDEFYKKRRDGLKGHDHYLVDGQSAPKNDRGRYNG